MKLTIIGHSYVRDLAGLNRTHIKVDNINVEVSYIYKPGADYNSFLSNKDLLAPVIKEQPNFVLVILAGNCIKGNNTNADTYDSCRQFYAYLKENLPRSKLISAQIELRFNQPNNKWNNPLFEDYCRRRNTYNVFLKKLKLKDYVLLIGGRNSLDDRKFYRDSVHLNSLGLEKYFEYIKNIVTYILKGKN